MNGQRFVFAAAFLVLSSVACFSQTTNRKSGAAQNASTGMQGVKLSPAYAEILLQKTELEAQLEDLLVGFTEGYPKIKELRFQLDLIRKQTDRLLSVNPADAGKLSQALGKLIVRKVELETELWNLKAQYNDDYPQVKRAKRKVEVFDQAIGEILP